MISQQRTILQAKKQLIIYGLQTPGELFNFNEISSLETGSSHFCFFSMTCKFWLQPDIPGSKGNWNVFNSLSRRALNFKSLDLEKQIWKSILRKLITKVKGP